MFECFLCKKEAERNWGSSTVPLCEFCWKTTEGKKLILQTENDQNCSSATQLKYKEVPLHRTSSFNTLLILAGLFLFPPFIWWCCLNVITGDIYRNSTDKNGNLETWSKANKYAAWAFMFLQVITIILIIYSIS